MQAYLHFKPDMFYKLFTYQKIFCRLVGKYRFDTCHAYDREMRMSLAAELSVAPSQRLHKWEVVSHEYMNIHLQDQLLPPPLSTNVCYSCHLEGHFAGACPLKKSRMMTNPNANLGSTYSSPAHLQSAIHQPIPTTDMANHGQISYAKVQPTKFLVNGSTSLVFLPNHHVYLHISATNVVGVTMLE